MAAPAVAQAPVAARAAGLDAIDGIVTEEIAAGRLPGAVIVVGLQGRVAWRRAIGARRILPTPAPMTVDTIFDAASLTKVVVTAPAILQLAESGRLALDQPVSGLWPAFGANGKSAITVRQLLTHYAGLPAGLPSSPAWSGHDDAIRIVEGLKPVRAPGTAFRYSDVDFIVLGELVRRISGQSLDAYATRHILAPLGMRDSRFTPDEALRERIAPADPGADGLRWGRVQDPTAARMGGVAGHAGLFTTADDLVRLATMLLDPDAAPGRILRRRSVEAMTRPQSPPGQVELRGLGWDIDSVYARRLANWFSPHAYGHTGYTGTALWIDPQSRSFLIVLTNRLHPQGSGDIGPLLRRVARVAGLAAWRTTNAGARPRVATGIDVAQSFGLQQLKGLRLGLITNRSGQDAGGRRTAEILRAAPGVRLAALFSPEHGLAAAAEGRIASGTDAGTGLPVHSLYGEVRRPTEAMLTGIDALVFDIQDAGARFYTYASTMGYAMEAAAARKMPFIVLDRPNPLKADTVQGPVLDADLVSFTGYLPMPVRHGMTLGELARLFNAEKAIGADLHVVAMRNYGRDLWYDETGLPWIAPSPNLRSVAQAVLYPGVALVEGANVSVGRGTDLPFEVIGAPWIDGAALAAWLSGRAIGGVRFDAATFMPRAAIHAGKSCAGVRLRLEDRDALDSPRLGIEIVAALHRLFGSRFEIERTLPLVGSRRTLAAIRAGDDPLDVARSWRDELARFTERRARHLLY